MTSFFCLSNANKLIKWLATDKLDSGSLLLNLNVLKVKLVTSHNRNLKEPSRKDDWKRDNSLATDGALGILIFLSVSAAVGCLLGVSRKFKRPSQRLPSAKLQPDVDGVQLKDQQLAPAKWSSSCPPPLVY